MRTDFALAEVLPEPGLPWRRLLRLDGEDCSHVDLRNPTHIDFAYVRWITHVVDVLAPPGQPLRALHLGGGGFTLPRYVAATRPGSRSDVAEVDAGLVALARKHLGLRTSRELRVRVADGREVLERARPAHYDLVVLDAFVGIDVPPQLATVEAAAAARRALAPSGALAVNVIDAPPLPAARAMAATLAEAFPEVAVVSARKVLRGRQGGNVILLGNEHPLPLRRLQSRLIHGAAPAVLTTGVAARAFAGGARPSRDGEPPPPALR